MSAAARAAEIDRQDNQSAPTYLLLEGSPGHAKTIQRYQKGKHVMAEPGYLDLRSDLRFGEGRREEVLGAWIEDFARLGVNARFDAAVKRISGAKGDFAVELSHGEVLHAAAVVLAIGLEGNPRKLGVPGEDSSGVQYQLDDPKEYTDETIFVVGASDSAIENALALSAQNDVWIVNRKNEFSRAKDKNLNDVLAAINDRDSRLDCFYDTNIKQIAYRADQSPPLSVVLNTPTGEKTVEAHRIIARLGADPPRRFVESIGIRFPNARDDAVPELSPRYESNVPGIFIVGSLAGYPLIKQAMNQGYDVAEFVYGHDIKPADYPLLECQLRGLPFKQDADALLNRFKERIPMFGELNALAFRELLIESEIKVAYATEVELLEAKAKVDALVASFPAKRKRPRVTRIMREAEAIYQPGEFGTSFFTIVSGEVTLQQPQESGVTTTLHQGEFFGEMSLLSGRPRTERAIAGPACIVVETPRRTMLKLMSSNEDVRKGIDWIFIVRELQRHFAPRATLAELRGIASGLQVRRYKAAEKVFAEGDAGDSLFIVRSGGLSLTRRREGADVLVAQVPSGQLVGEMALMGDPQRRETAVATVASELIELKRPAWQELVQRDDARVRALQVTVSERVTDNARMQVRPEAGSVMNFLMAEGLGEATDALIIDETLCIGCDNCEKACAETHGGITRLDRKAGATFANVHIPVVCRHCEQPHCMKDCPPNAIRRSITGEVFIDETCIGCGNCQSNCPYDVIRMEYDAPKKPGLLAWLIAGMGTGPGEAPEYHPTRAALDKGKKAVKCDACMNLSTGPACVNACPTGAAIRIGPDKFLDLVEERRR